MNNQTRGSILVIASAIIWGTVGTVTRFAGSVDAATISFYRFLFGTITIFIIILFSKKLPEILPRKKTLYVILLGIVVALTVGFLTLSIKTSTIANALLLFYTAPVFATFLSRIFLKEKIKKTSFISLVLCVIGIIFILGNEFQTSLWLGTIFGLIGGISYASQMTVGRYLKEYSGLLTTFWMSVIAALLILPFASPLSVPGDKFPILMLLGITISGIAPFLFMEGIRYVKTQDAGIISMLDPFTNVILGALIFYEIPTPLTIIGGISILAAVLFQIKSAKNKS